MDVRHQIHEWMSQNREKAISMLRALVQCRSTQGNEAEAQSVIIRILEDMDVELDVWEPSGEELITHTCFHSVHNDFSGRPNVVGVWRGLGEGRSMILNGHIDVVPDGDPDHWLDDPYSGHVIDGKMFGRGVTDMKGGNVSLLLAIQVLQGLGIQLRGDVIFQSVIEEESGGAGTLAAILRGYTADGAIIPEPTRMRIFPKQQGSMWFRIHVTGRAAHGGTRYEGVSAIEKAMLVISHIQKLEQHRNHRITDILYKNVPIPVPINIGVIQGGNWPSSVPDQLILEGRMGVAPEESIQQAQVEMEEWITLLGNIDPWFSKNPLRLEWFGARWLPSAIDPKHELMQTIITAYRQVRQEDPLIEASPWGTDGGLLTHVGGTPTLVFGPGITEEAHQPNESIALSDVLETAEIVALGLIQWCGIAPQKEETK